MPTPDDFYGPRRSEIADTGAFVGFLVGFLGAAPVGWSALMASFEEGANATWGVTRFAGTLIAGGLLLGLSGYLIGSLFARVWESRHRREHPVAKPEAGADGARDTAATPSQTVESVARLWRQNAVSLEVVLRRFEMPDEVRELMLGRFEIVQLGGLTIGRATYQPGWKWSEHVGPGVGASRCTVAHVGLVLAGEATAAMDGGEVHHLKAGTLFHIPAAPHDSWVVGDAPYVSLHFLGAEQYAR